MEVQKNNWAAELTKRKAQLDVATATRDQLLTDISNELNLDYKLDDLQKQALVCMYYAMLPKTDARYKQRMHDWEVLEKRFGTKKTTYKHAKDAFDFYFPNNGRKGWSDDRDLKRRGHAYQEVFELYKDYSADQLEKAVAEIIHGYENEEPTYVSMK